MRLGNDGKGSRGRLPPVVSSLFSIKAAHWRDGIRGTELGARGKERTARQRRVIGYWFSDVQATRLPLQASSRVRGSASRGVKVIDDFGHHPTAITQTLTGLRHRYSGHRIWAVFEPRSNTTRRAVFQQELPVALGLADGVFLSEVARLEQIPVDERLHPEAVIEAIAATGKPAFYEKNADAILRRLVPLL